MSEKNVTKYVDVPGPGRIPARDSGRGPVLECSHLGIEFGGLKAVEEFNIAIGATEIGGLIGPNGAGKTTVFNGVILLDGKDTHGMNTAQVNQAGIARTFQNIRLFDKLTVEENVKVGMHNNIDYHLPSSILRLPKFWKEEKKAHEKALELLDIFGMADIADVKASSLPYGAQRRLEIVSAGMNPSETEELMNNIRKIRDTFGIAVLLIEHDMNLVMGICENIIVLNFGKVIAKGTPEQIQNNPVVIEAYLGSQSDDEESGEGFAASAAKEAARKAAEDEKNRINEAEEASVDVEE